MHPHYLLALVLLSSSSLTPTLALALRERDQTTLSLDNFNSIKDAVASAVATSVSSLPDGIYLESCEDCSISSGAVLSCQCYNASGSLLPETFLDNAWACSGCITNIDGQLYCQLPTSSDVNGYQAVCQGCGVSFGGLFCDTCAGVSPSPIFFLHGACGCQSVSFVNRLQCNTYAPTALPTDKPTKIPTTSSPTLFPTSHPTTQFPTRHPSTKSPTLFPTDQPTSHPTTKRPTTRFPTSFPTSFPTNFPTNFPTTHPTTKSPTSKSPTSKSPTTGNPTLYPTDQPTTPTFAPVIPAPPACASYWLDINGNGQEMAPYKTCEGGDFTTTQGCQYQNYCCWQPTSTTAGVCKIPNGVTVDCPSITTSAGCGNYPSFCIWNASYGTSGLCERICPGNPQTMCVY